MAFTTAFLRFLMYLRTPKQKETTVTENYDDISAEF